MKTYRADLHIHTVLSPCADLYMSPRNIIDEAKKKGIGIIGITDHNTTLQAPLIEKIGRQQNIFVLCGAEVTTKEEAHVLCFFSNFQLLGLFQKYLDQHLPNIKNNTELFGYQVQVDINENICYTEERLLISAINQTIEQIEQKTHSLGGIFIPAHINKTKNSIISQLGFVPPDLNYDALELSKHTTYSSFVMQNKYLKNASFIKSSDAHFVNDIGSTYTNFIIDRLSFESIKKAIKNNFANNIDK